MSIYLGVRCPVCSKKFTASDDVVVCPICGAPHHRECYAKENACAFEAEHLSGKVWRAPADAPPVEEQAETVACPRCHSVNPKGSSVCQVCGMFLTGNAQQTAHAHGNGHGGQNGPYSGQNQEQQHSHGPQARQNNYGWSFPGMEGMIDPSILIYGGLSPDEEIDGEVVRDLALYIGDSSAYYLTRFKAISQTNRTLSANFAAFFFNFFYFFYRKMYLPGCILLGVFLAGLIPDLLYGIEMFPQTVVQLGFADYFRDLGFDITGEVNLAAAQQFAQLSRITHMLMFTIGTFFSLCANRLYYYKAVTAVHNLRTELGEQRDERVYVEALSNAGGYSKAAVLITVAALFVIYFVANSIITYMILF